MGRAKNSQANNTSIREPVVFNGPTPRSSFAVKARRVEILPHDNADALELAKFDDYVTVVLKGQFKTGDLVLYIPEQAIVPDPIIEELGLVGKLAGGAYDSEGKKKRNRVKAIRLRGILSQGLVYAPDTELEENKDYSEQLGIEKWSPPVPTQLSGKIKPAPGLHSYTNIENIKKHPDLIKENEEVIFTEKLHGSCTITALVHDDTSGEPEMVVSSKGVTGRGFSLERTLDDKGNDENAYWRMAERYDLNSKLAKISEKHPGEDVYIYGETLGVQDLKYGLNKADLDFRAFDIKVGDKYLDYNEYEQFADQLELPRVPVLYRGPYNREAIEKLATGKEQFTGDETHIREGGVVKPTVERRDDKVGRVILKVISPDYLLRGNATEYE